MGLVEETLIFSKGIEEEEAFKYNICMCSQELLKSYEINILKNTIPDKVNSKVVLYWYSMESILKKKSFNIVVAWKIINLYGSLGI